MIYVITGAVRTGKSTRVYDWMINRNDIGGFLSLDEGPLRKLHNAFSKKIIPHQVEAGSTEEVLNIGKFTFLKSSFDEAIAWTKKHNENPDINYIIIDELGKLEVKDNGFADLIKFLLDKSNKDLIIIVRDYLYDIALEVYNIENHIRLTRDELDRIR